MIVADTDSLAIAIAEKLAIRDVLVITDMRDITDDVSHH
jgi:aspartokinase-like uncharacterized kinase